MEAMPTGRYVRESEMKAGMVYLIEQIESGNYLQRDLTLGLIERQVTLLGKLPALPIWERLGHYETGWPSRPIWMLKPRNPKKTLNCMGIYFEADQYVWYGLVRPALSPGGAAIECPAHWMRYEIDPPPRDLRVVKWPVADPSPFKLLASDVQLEEVLDFYGTGTDPYHLCWMIQHKIEKAVERIKLDMEEVETLIKVLGHDSSLLDAICARMPSQ